MPTYDVTQRAFRLTTGAAQPYQLKNSGNYPIYVGLDIDGVGSAVTAEIKDHTINPGGFLGLTGQSAAWIVTDAGRVGQVEQIFNASGAYSPGPSVIALRSDVVLLDTENVAYLAGAVGGGGAVRTIDVSGYSSVIFTIEVNAANGVLAANIANYIGASLSFTDDDPSTVTPICNNELEPQWLLCQIDQNISGSILPQSIQVPVTGRYFKAFLEFGKAATATGGTITSKIYGSGEVITSPRYVSRGSGMVKDLVVRGSWTQLSPAGVTTNYFVSSANGIILATAFWAGGTGGQVIASALIAGTAYALGSVKSATATGNEGQTRQFLLPLAPLRMSLAALAGSQITGSVMQNV